MNEKRSSQEEIVNEFQKILEDRGKNSLERTRTTVMEEKIESKEVRDALAYFMKDCWHDLARPALLSLACEAVGGDPNMTIPIAVPMSLISGAIDIHDDIIDESPKKGPRLTVFGKFGKEVALLAGDALLFKGFNLLYNASEQGIPAKKISAISEVIKKTFFELGDAEALELQFRGRCDVTFKEYLQVVRKKAADVEAHTHISALLGEGNQKAVEAISEYGRLLGMLIILRDDLIDMIDPEETTHRIKKEHISLPMIYALQNIKNKNEINSILHKKTLTKKDAKKLLDLVDMGGGFGFVEEIMNNLGQNALTLIDTLNFNKKQLAVLIKRMLLPEWRNFLTTTMHV
jgi:geranylgeranyl diphosphate synthase type I